MRARGKRTISWLAEGPTTRLGSKSRAPWVYIQEVVGGVSLNGYFASHGYLAGAHWGCCLACLFATDRGDS